MKYSIYIRPNTKDGYCVKVCKFVDISHEDYLFHSDAKSITEAYNIAKKFIKKHKKEYGG